MPQGNRNLVNETGLAGQLRRAWLAGMSAARTAREEVEDLVNRFVERGEQVERDGRELVHGVIGDRTKSLTGRIESARTLTRDFAGELAEKLEVAVEKVLAQMPLASRTDLVQLNDRIDRLSRKLDRLERK